MPRPRGLKPLEPISKTFDRMAQISTDVVLTYNQGYHMAWALGFGQTSQHWSSGLGQPRAHRVKVWWKDGLPNSGDCSKGASGQWENPKSLAGGGQLNLSRSCGMWHGTCGNTVMVLCTTYHMLNSILWKVELVMIARHGMLRGIGSFHGMPCISWHQQWNISLDYHYQQSNSGWNLLILLLHGKHAMILGTTYKNNGSCVVGWFTIELEGKKDAFIYKVTFTFGGNRDTQWSRQVHGGQLVWRFSSSWHSAMPWTCGKLSQYQVYAKTQYQVTMQGHVQPVSAYND